MDSFVSSTNHDSAPASAFQSCAIITNLKPGGNYNTSLNFGAFNEFIILSASCRLEDNITCPLVIDSAQTQIIQIADVYSLNGRCVSSFINETTCSVVITSASPNIQFMISCGGTMPGYGISGVYFALCFI